MVYLPGHFVKCDGSLEEGHSQMFIFANAGIESLRKTIRNNS